MLEQILSTGADVPGVRLLADWTGTCWL